MTRPSRWSRSVCNTSPMKCNDTRHPLLLLKQCAADTATICTGKGHKAIWRTWKSEWKKRNPRSCRFRLRRSRPNRLLRPSDAAPVCDRASPAFLRFSRASLRLAGEACISRLRWGMLLWHGDAGPMENKVDMLPAVQQNHLRDAHSSVQFIGPDEHSRATIFTRASCPASPLYGVEVGHGLNRLPTRQDKDPVVCPDFRIRRRVCEGVTPRGHAVGPVQSHWNQVFLDVEFQQLTVRPTLEQHRPQRSAFEPHATQDTTQQPNRHRPKPTPARVRNNFAQCAARAFQRTHTSKLASTSSCSISTSAALTLDAEPVRSGDAGRAFWGWEACWSSSLVMREDRSLPTTVRRCGL